MKRITQTTGTLFSLLFALMLTTADTFSQTFSLLKDLTPNGSSMFYEPAVYNRELYFYKYLSNTLYKTDGTTNGTVEVKNIGQNYGYDIMNLFPTPMGLFFIGNDSIHGMELWKSDGTAAGTNMLADLNPTGNAFTSSNMDTLNGYLYFGADNGTNGSELWKSDGTAAGTVLLLDIDSGIESSSPANFHATNSLVYFCATTPSEGTELWRTDGTAAGTFMLKDINAGVASSVYSQSAAIVIGDILYFVAESNAAANNFGNEYETELWRTDGTVAGTYMVADLTPDGFSSYPHGLYNINGTLFYSAVAGNEVDGLYKSDGTAAGTQLVFVADTFYSSPYTYLTSFKNKIYFTSYNSATGNELWVTDSLGQNTELVKDINAGAASSDAHGFIVLGNKLYFFADDGIHGTELWETDGTTAGTILTGEVNAGNTSLYSCQFASKLNGAIIFDGDNDNDGNELWKYLPLPEIQTRPLSTTDFCAGEQLMVNYRLQAGEINSSNTFVAELSDSTGSFVNPTVIGEVNSAGLEGTIASVIPGTINTGSQYRIKVREISTPFANEIDNGNNITIHPLPAVNAVAAADTITYGSQAVLTASGAAAYTWSNSYSGPTSYDYPVSTQEYIVTGTDNYGCVNSDTVLVVVDFFTSDKTVKATVLNIFPNPTNGIINANLNLKDNAAYTASISNMQGQIVMQQKGQKALNARNLNFDLSDLADGTYILSVDTDNEHFNERITVQK